MSMEGFSDLPNISGSGEVLGNAYIRLGVQTAGMASDVKKGVAVLNAEMQKAGAGLEQGLSMANRQLAIANQQAGSFLRMISLAGSVLKMVGVASIPAIVIGSAIQYDTALTQMTKTVKVSEQELNTLSKTFLEMSKSTITSAAGLVELAGAAGSVGVAAEDIVPFVDAVETLGLATDVSVGQATQALGTLSQTLHISSDEYMNFASSLVGLSNGLAVTSSQILGISQRVAAVGQNIGLTPQQILGFSAAIGSVGGMGTETAGNVLNKLFGGLQEFVGRGAEAGQVAQRLGVSLGGLAAHAKYNTEDFKDFAIQLGLTTSDLRELIDVGQSGDLLAKVAGMDTRGFAAMFESTPTQAIRAFIEGLGKMDAFSQQQTLEKLGFTDPSMQQGLIALASNIDLLNESLATGTEEWEKNTAAQEAADKQLDTLPARIEILKNTLMGVATSVGMEMMPKLKELVSWLTEMVPKAAEELSRVWDQILRPAFEPLLDALERLAATAGQLFTDWSAWAPLMGKAGDEAEALHGGLDGIASILAIVVNYMTTFVDALNSVLRLPFVKEIAQFAVVLGGVALQLKILMGLRGMLFSTLGAVGGALGGVAGRFAQRFGGQATVTPEAQAMMSAAEAHQTAAEALSQAAQDLSNAGQDDLSGAADELQAAVGGGSPALVPDLAAPPRLAKPGDVDFDVNKPLRMVNADGTMYFSPTAAPRPAPRPPPAYQDVAYDKEAARFRDTTSGRFVAKDTLPPAYANEAIRYASRNIVQRTAEDLSTGIKGLVTKAKGGLSSLASGASQALALAGKAFFPLMIADMVGNMIAPALGQGVAGLTGHSRHAMAQGWMEVIGNIASELEGIPADMLSRHPEYMIGGMPIATKTLISAGVSGSLLDQMEAGGFGGLLAQRDIAAALGPTMAAAANETKEQLVENVTTWGVDAQHDAFIALAQSLDIPLPELDLLTKMTSPEGRAAWAEQTLQLRDQLLTGWTDRMNQLDQAIIDSVVEAARALGIGITPIQVTRLGRGGQEELVNLMAAAGGAGAGGQMMAQMFAGEEMGGFTDVLEGGSAAFDTNTESVQKNTLAWQEWIAALDPAEQRTIAAATAWLQKYAPALEAAADEDLQGRVQALLELPKTFFTPEQQAIMDRVGTARAAAASAAPEDKAAADAAVQQALADADQLYSQVMEGVASFKTVAGVDQREQLANMVRDTIAEGFKGGMSWEEMKVKLGPSIDLLWDGIGDSATDGAQRVADAFGDSLGHAFSTLDTAGIIAWFENLTGEAMSGTTAQKIDQLADFYTQSFADELLSATPERRKEMLDQANAALPADQQMEWSEFVQRSLPGIREIWEMSKEQGTLGETAAMINRLFGDTEQRTRSIEDLDTLITKGESLQEMSAGLIPPVNPAGIAGLEGKKIGDPGVWFGLIPQPIAEGDANVVGTALQATVDDAVVGLDIPTEELHDKGAAMIAAVGAGASSEAAKQAFIARFNESLALLHISLPGSPVRGGPLKHPFLYRAGANIMKQIGMGAVGTSIPVGPIQTPPMGAAGYGRAVPRGAYGVSRPRGAGRPPTGRAPMGRGPGGGRGPSLMPSVNNQSIYVDTMTVMGPQDEQSIVRQLSFLQGK